MEPLASKTRPVTLEQFIGQEHLVGGQGPIRKFIETNSIPSMVFWGPPGTGKTTLAKIISNNAFYDFYKMSAVTSGKADLLKILGIAKQNQQYNKKTILFIDEIHRWNKAQQDALLPYVEKGVITLIGATTENPSFTVNNALISRSKVFVFNAHTQEDIRRFLEKVIKQEFPTIKIEPKALEILADYANGDMRSALNALEISTSLAKANKQSQLSDSSDKKNLSETTLTKETILNAIQKNIYYDRNGDEHYNIISAVHKSLRSSNADAACYWVRRMIDGGEDPLYIARRLLRFASEDIGNADPNAIVLANSVYDSCAKIGLPECDVFLMQLAIYLANAPKDNTAYIVAQLAKKDVHQYGNLPVPMHLRNAPTKLMEELGYSEGYEYDHDLEGKKSKQECMPEKLKGKKYIK